MIKKKAINSLGPKGTRRGGTQEKEGTAVARRKDLCNRVGVKT